LLLPALGSQRSVIAIATMIAACGLLLLLALHRARRPFAVTAGVAGTLLFVTAAANAPDPLGTLFEQRFPGARLPWHEEGVQTTLTVQELDSGARVLYLDGLFQATDSPSAVRVSRRLGALPLAIHDRPSDILVVGLGAGTTAGGASQSDDAHVDV